MKLIKIKEIHPKDRHFFDRENLEGKIGLIAPNLPSKGFSPAVVEMPEGELFFFASVKLEVV